MNTLGLMYDWKTIDKPCIMLIVTSVTEEFLGESLI